MESEKVVDEASKALRGLTWQRGLMALAVLLGFFLVATVAGRLVRRRLSRGAGWGGPIFAVSKLLTYILVFIGLVTAASMLGLPLSSLLLMSSALLVGIGFSLQHITQDFVAGIILLVEQSIRKNDFVTFGQTAGTVREIGLRATHLLTVDGTALVVPNHLLVTTEVSNHSHPIKRDRLAVEVPVSLREDVDLVRHTLLDVARGHPLVLNEPPPTVRIDEIRDSDFQFKLIVWVHDPVAGVRIASELRFAVAQAFGARGLRFPTPELQLHAAPGQAEPSALTETPH